MWLSGLAILVPVMLSTALQVPRSAATNPCAVCHLRLVWTRSGLTHVDQWVTSRHALYDVGCERCHGGDAKTSDETAAHRGVKKNSADPTSAVHWMSLPATCGRCHRREADAFARSAHRQLMSKGDPAVPGCTSCHTSMAGDVPSPRDLEVKCRQCHGAEPLDRAYGARRAIEELAPMRTMLKRARLEIAAVTDPVRRASLTTQWTETDTSLRGVVAALHEFDLPTAEDRLQASRIQVERLRAGLMKR